MNGRHGRQAGTRTIPEFTYGDLAEFTELCSQQTYAEDCPRSSEIASNVPIYDAAILRSSIKSDRDATLDELHTVLLTGPGVFVIRSAFGQAVVDRASSAFDTIVASEKANGKDGGDHFAAHGANDRIWNSFQKHALVDPASFVEYYGNEILALAAEAWLGPGYAITAQTNIVRPGARAQEPHRDYHLGFQTAQVAARFPPSAQIASALLTLQGAVAHSDMPLPSGPTLLLPHSQKYEAGFLAYREPAFRAVFDKMRIQIPLKKGDALFFSPALFHAAGSNTTEDVQRSANLLQISAAWGKPMETVDRSAIVKAVWEEMAAFCACAGEGEKAALLAAVPDAYSFPTNLDNDPPPAGGHCPPTQAERVARGLEEGVDADEMGRQIDAYDAMRRASVSFEPCSTKA
ncbi:hypothetical protein CspeluHIS016_0702880 [Cutaneotrichosporon spelunceum]|uniref:Phytanoyl-CoA dioxygenase n=1 Tax=Cutaneotrichosporon spelunceum TaxID=1672016 RepID=A0AAD3YEM3_9TREE|nr:hypothetical protein CspeluHIS016_0702880 [Cutaneotrichosporon spelunceum]